MIDKHVLFGLWLILLILFALLILCVRFTRTSRWALSLKEVFDLALSGVAPVVLGGQLVLDAWFKLAELQKLVGLEGACAIALGGFASAWFGVSKIYELTFKDPS